MVHPVQMRIHRIAVALLLLAACSSDKATSGTTGPVDSTTVPVTTTILPATTAADTTTSTTSTTSTTTSTTTPCTVSGDVSKKESSDPLAMSSLVGADIRTGTHPCFERIVIELEGSGDFPGWWVEYVDDPVRLGESEEFVDITGNATLLVRMGMWMQDMEGNGYPGPSQVFPTNVSHILELRNTENWEGVTLWAIGLDSKRPFTVSVLTGPPRLVIDVQTG